MNFINEDIAWKLYSEDICNLTYRIFNILQKPKNWERDFAIDYIIYYLGAL